MNNINFKGKELIGELNFINEEGTDKVSIQIKGFVLDEGVKTPIPLGKLQDTFLNEIFYEILTAIKEHSEIASKNEGEKE